MRHGDYLVSGGKVIGRLSPDAFDDFMRVAALQHNSQFAAMIEERLESSVAMPAYWARELNHYHKLLLEYQLQDDYWVPLDLAVSVSTAEAKVLAQRYVLQYGELLCWWPAMRAVAQTLKLQGRNLGEAA